MLSFVTHPSPVGDLLLVASAGGLQRIVFLDVDRGVRPESDWVEDPVLLAPVALQLDEYFRGERQAFDLKLDPQGTPFDRSVWQEVCRVPYGETATYGTIARRVGQPAATRAVGGANGRNPLPIVIPCHRIIGSNGSLTGYGGGLPTKVTLLDLESTRAGRQLQLFVRG